MPELLKPVGTKGTLPSANQLESIDDSYKEKEKLEEGATSLPSTREIKSREKMAPKPE
jgi:hypothetical protein